RPRNLPPFLSWMAPRAKKRTPSQCCELCELHSPLLEAPLVHLMGLLGYEMYTHLQSLRAMHPATRSEVTNAMLEKLFPWYQSQYLMPGTTVKGCLACALGRLYNDAAAMNAVAVLTKSGRRRGKWPKEIIYPLLIKEGWLGVWAEGARGTHDVMKDRNEARKMTSVSTKEWSDSGKGVDFKPVVWAEKRNQGSSSSSGYRGSAGGKGVDFKPVVWGEKRHQGSSSSSGYHDSSAMSSRRDPPRSSGPVRPDRPKGLTLGVSMLGEQKKRWTAPSSNGHQGVFSKPPPIPERSSRREQVRAESPLSPLSPKSRRPEMQAPPHSSQKHRSQPPPAAAPLHRSHTTTNARPLPPRRADINNVTIPAPLRVASHKAHHHARAENPFRDPQRSKSTRATTKPPPPPPSPPTNPFFSREERLWELSSDDDSSDDEAACIVRPSKIADEYSDSDYSADETEQRYIDEHDELLKAVGGVGRFGGNTRPRTRDYLNTLPRMESRVTAAAVGKGDF
ncbi:MAG: hypothetical protein LQ346_008816, partial [Caloplaca aetnensis]